MQFYTLYTANFLYLGNVHIHVVFWEIQFVKGVTFQQVIHNKLWGANPTNFST